MSSHDGSRAELRPIALISREQMSAKLEGHAARTANTRRFLQTCTPLARVNLLDIVKRVGVENGSTDDE